MWDLGRVSFRSRQGPGLLLLLASDCVASGSFILAARARDMQTAVLRPFRASTVPLLESTMEGREGS